MNTTITQRIKEVLKHYDVSEKSLANEFDIPQTTINSALRPEKTKVSTRILEVVLTKFPEVRYDWLLTGEGPMFKNNKEGSATPLYAASSRSSARLRFLEISPTATFTEFASASPETYDTVEITLDPGEDVSDDDVVFKINGDSMEPMIPDHASVLGQFIRPSQWHWARGVVIIAFDNSFVIKRIRENRLDQENFLTLCSDNPLHPSVVKVSLDSIHSMFRAIRVVSSPIH